MVGLHVREMIPRVRCTEKSRADFDLDSTLPASRQAFVEFRDGTGDWRKYFGRQASDSNALVLHTRSHISGLIPQIHDQLDSEDLEAQNVETHSVETSIATEDCSGALEMSNHQLDSNLSFSSLSPLMDFGSFATDPMHNLGILDFSQTSPSWNYGSGSTFGDQSLDFSSLLSETSVVPSNQRCSTPENGHRTLVTREPIALTTNHGYLRGARSFVNTLINYAKTNRLRNPGPESSEQTEVPDAEDIIESLESMIPEDMSSFTNSGLALNGRYPTSSSSLFKTLLYSFTNNFAGLRGVPRSSLLQLLRDHHEIRTQLLELVKFGAPSVAKPLAENLFRAAIEGCDPEMVKLIHEHTKKDPSTAVDPNAITCNFRGEDYTPMELAAKFRNIDLVQILAMSHADPNKTYGREDQEEWERGALCLALSHWDWDRRARLDESPPAPVNLELLKVLLDCGAEVHIRLVETEMRMGAGHTTVAEQLILRISATRHRIFFQSITLLVGIAHYLDNSAAARIIRRLFDDCDESKDCGSCKSEHPQLIERTLCHAARRSNLELSKFLVRHTARLQSALAAAVRSGNAQLIDFFLDMNAPVDGAVESWPNYEEDDDVVDFYDEDQYDAPVQQVAQIYMRTPLRTPLAEAIRAGDDHLIQIFTRRGALRRLAEKHHFHAAALAAVEAENISYLEMVLGHAPALPERTHLGVALAVAIRNDETDAALLLLDAGADPSPKDLNYTAPLISAIKRRNRRVVDAMLEFDAELDSFQGFILHPLEFAVAWGELDIVEDMIRMGAMIDMGLEVSPLVAAVRSENHSLIHRLLELGAKPDARSPQQGLTPLQAAVEIGDHDVVRFLIHSGATPADPLAFAHAMESNPVGFGILLSAFKSQYPQGLKGFGGYVLANAIKMNSPTIFNDLLGARMDVNSWCAVDFIMHSNKPQFQLNDIRILGFAIQHKKKGDYELVRKLLELGAEPESIVVRSQYAPPRKRHQRLQWIRNFKTPLLLAIEMRNLEKASLLLQHKADVNRPARRGLKRTPLQAACETGSYKMVELLLLQGARVNDPAASTHGGTALQMAAKTGSLGIMKLLLDNGADPHMAKSKVGGLTAFEAAAESGCIDILDLLWNAAHPSGFGEAECQSARDLSRGKGHRGCVDFSDFLLSNTSGNQSLLNGGVTRLTTSSKSNATAD